MSSENTIHIGVATREAIRKRTIDIAAGRVKPAPGDPKIWVTSPKVVAQILSEENLDLIHAIKRLNPKSVSSLAEATGRSQGNVSRTLKKLTELGIVELVREDRQARPVVAAEKMQLEVEFF
ncbi:MULTISPECIES: MarR family transcriptional regulator [Stenotrophomonas]|uniref:MarR family transcriptional regulator n=1 Tax=Stenotrophomonas muris TaxID=2963283 RepID=A0ABU5MNM1_9GAMM|nr:MULTISPECIES: MarR family transcriptional regulator [Gammaproteobacteria]MBH1489481.1 ArsR family transcriptional regulator [Stenotrophomonas maltophilia]MBN5070591.1 ArsR family transcriptional regulator [Stenotrophomonas maltophilia]MDQ7313755.1 MarR family transcriptional regulator [Stenotrophomonas sp. Sm8]MDZ7514358.1 MarR family transcriptional regulator [Stenotrophomonas muris]